MIPEYELIKACVAIEETGRVTLTKCLLAMRGRTYVGDLFRMDDMFIDGYNDLRTCNRESWDLYQCVHEQMGTCGCYACHPGGNGRRPRDR